MLKEILKVADEIVREKGFSRKIISNALRDAIYTALVKKLGKYGEPVVEIDLEKNIFNISVPKEVVEDVDSVWHEILLDDALKIDKDAYLGKVIMVPVTIEEIGRQLATTVKTRLFEKLRDAEKDIVYSEFQGKVGEIITGIVLKSDKEGVTVSIGKTEAILPKKEMIPGDYYTRGDYIRALLLEIKLIKGWPQLVLSRTHPQFLKKLFESEIPEVFDGLVEVKSVAREPGDRAKVAVYSTSSNIDPVGACIGLKGVRINAISNELKGEKIDVIQWSPDPVKFVCASISPAEVLLTNIFEDESTIEVVVPDDQLSLAIGKRGQNVKLASILTGWKLDILKESEYKELRKQRLIEQEQEMKEFYMIYSLDNLTVLTDEMISKLVAAGVTDLEKLADTDVDRISEILNISHEDAINILNAALDYLASVLEE
ncbi:transcription termination factor NusA [Calditerrivibrio nitroreducens]|uniref:Transcription termination/antitermination protein NusA n=1 Tax=Calditerrivibrio nitroreducens (strain DSM 19672 / NBRC 101217 / Yu37-1) TaxID=768670 RepID=E4TJE2_CALNY|nr:transcription termination factor NusA [Calditerrivibrio nitroreducens]ADR19209.1 NusA antitermination factor [Calditerrivibrio nitroreducens DSM 19672]